MKDIDIEGSPELPAIGRHGVGHAILRAFGLLVPAVALAAIIMATGDIAGMAGQSYRYISGVGDATALGLLVVGVYAWSGLWVVIALGLVLALVSGARPDEMTVHARGFIVEVLFGRDVKVGARILSGLVSVAGFFGVMYLAVSKIADKVNSSSLAGLSAAGIAVGAVAGFAVFWAILSVLLGAAGRLPVLKKLLAARTVSAGIVALGVAGFVAAVVFEHRIFKSLDGWLIYLPALSLVAAFFMVVFAPFRTRFRQARVAGVVVSVVLVVATVPGLLVAGNSDGPRALLFSFGKNGAQAARLWSRVFDFDHDGASTFLGGGDCEPFNPAVYPGAPDIPDNDIDEDCLDGDLKSALLDPRPATLTNPFKGVKKPDVLLISVDGCRRDALGAYGAAPDHTPNLDRLATESVVFEDAIAPASWTTPAFAAILTGRYAGEIPGYYGLSKLKPVPSSLPLMFKPFDSAGYRTVAVTAGIQLDKLGLNRDLDDWVMVSKGPRARLAGKVADRAIKVIKNDKGDKPLFLWVHFIDAHYPYDPPKEHLLFSDDPRGRYEGEIHYADEGVGKILDALQESGRADRTIVMVFADHGEAFQEHGRGFHGESVYAEEVRVPLMVRIPTVAPSRLPNLVSTLDIGPTLWDLIGTKKTQPTRGMSLAPLIMGGSAPDRGYVFSEQTRKVKEFGLTSPDFRLRYDRTLNRYELFDRNADPAEQNDISAINPLVLREMRIELTRNMAAIDAVANSKVGDVLLGSIPKGYSLSAAGFKGGPRLAAYKIVRRDRKVTFVSVFKAGGPIKKPARISVAISVRDKAGKTLWTGTKPITGGVYAPARWHKGDLVKHQVDFKLKAVPPKGAKICLALIGDKDALETGKDAFEKCFDLR